MLPPGIFLWESGFEGLVFPTDISRINASHSSWKKAMELFGPWERLDDSPLDGGVQKSSHSTSSSIVVVDRCTSTMEVARELAEQGVLGEWGVVVAVTQEGGRGQLRRHWVSSPGNLHFSMVLPSQPKDGPWAMCLSDLLPLVAGYIVSEVLLGLGGDIQIKWPNDILQGKRKVGGLLIEESNGRVILGAGINLSDYPSDRMMREDCSVSAGKLQMSNGPGTPLGLLEILVSRGKNVYIDVLDELLPVQFLSAVTRRLAWLGRTVLVHEGNQPTYEAVIVGLSPQGGLVIRRSGKESVLYSGSVFPL